MCARNGIRAREIQVKYTPAANFAGNMHVAGRTWRCKFDIPAVLVSAAGKGGKSFKSGKTKTHAKRVLEAKDEGQGESYHCCPEVKRRSSQMWDVCVVF